MKRKRKDRCGAGTTCARPLFRARSNRSEEHTSELQSRLHLVCRLLLEKKKKALMRFEIPYKHLQYLPSSRLTYSLSLERIYHIADHHFRWYDSTSSMLFSRSGELTHSTHSQSYNICVAALQSKHVSSSISLQSLPLQLS